MGKKYMCLKHYADDYYEYGVDFYYGKIYEYKDGYMHSTENGTDVMISENELRCHWKEVSNGGEVMETMYERIKRMTEDEMKCFVYWVYLMGNEDGWNQYCDSNGGYFGGHMLTLDREEVMPNDSIADLWNKLDDTREYYKGNK